MIPKEWLKKIRQIELRTVRLVEDLMAGQYHSVFKGRGMDFDEVREYLGHSGAREGNATYVWLSRHGVEPVRIYDANEVIRERTTRKPWGSATRR